MMKSRSSIGILRCALIALLGATRAAAATAPGDYAQALMEMRAAIESLQNEIDIKKANLKARSETLAAQQAELDLAIKRERIRANDLESRWQTQQQRQSKSEEDEKILAPLIVETCKSMEKHIAASLPFKTKERAGEIAELRRSVENRKIRPGRALPRLWSFVEDELRLTHENGLFRQIIPIDGTETLADVARIGMVMLYFRTSDGKVGMATHAVDGWKFVTLHESTQKKNVATLMDSFRKGIKVGHFALPNALASLPRQNSL